MSIKVFSVQLSANDSDKERDQVVQTFEDKINSFLRQNEDYEEMQPLQSTGGTPTRVETTLTVILKPKTK